MTADLTGAKRIADGLQFACRIPDKTPDFSACGGPAAEAYWEYFTPARIVSLVAALEVALKQADHFASEADRFGKLSETADEESAAARLVVLAAWQAYDRCARELREAITAALAGGAL